MMGDGVEERIAQEYEEARERGFKCEFGMTGAREEYDKVDEKSEGRRDEQSRGSASTCRTWTLFIKRETYLDDLALLTLVGTSGDLDLIVLSDGEGSGLHRFHKEASVHLSTRGGQEGEGRRTLYCSLNSLERVELMIFRRMDEGASK
jgi:hypothetical protein